MAKIIINKSALNILMIVMLVLQFGAVAQDWQPEQPIVITVPSNPGGGWDQLGRFMQRAIIKEELSPVSVEVVNRGGAGGIIALSELVARFNNNPHKLMVSGFGMTGATIMHNSEFDLLSTTPLARLTSEYQAIGVPYNSPFQTLEELMDAFKANPKSIIWGGGSAGGADHLFVNLLAEDMAVAPHDINYVAFTGGGEATAALMGGQVTVGVSGYSEWGSLVEAKRVRLLGISSPTRSINPTIATFKEIGINVVYENWRCLVAAPGITNSQEQYLIDLLTKARESETWQQIVKRNNWQDSFLAGEEFRAFIEKDSIRTRRIIERSGLGAGGEGYAVIGPYFFPVIVGIGLLVSGGMIAVSWWRSRQASGIDVNKGSLIPFVKICTLIIFYLAGLKVAGFIYVTPLFIPAMAYLFGSKSHVKNIIIGVVLTLVITLVFENFLNVIVP